MTTTATGNSDSIEAMAAVMIDKFGTRAPQVAKAQLSAAEHANPAAADVWRQIIDIIHARTG